MGWGVGHNWQEGSRQILHFLTPVNIRGGLGEISGLIVEALSMQNLQNTFDGHPMCGYWAQCIDKK